MQRFRRGLAVTFLTQIFSAADRVFLVPLFLRAWGTDGYGHWLTLTAFVSYLMLLDLGAQGFIGNSLTIAYVEGDITGFRKYVSDSWALFLVICTCIFIVLVIVLALPGVSIPGRGHAMTLNDRMVLGFMGTSYLIMVFSGVTTTLYRATGRYALGQMLSTIWIMVQFSALALGLVLRISTLTYALVFLCIWLLRASFFLWHLSHIIPEIRGIKINVGNAIGGRFLLGGSLFFWLISVAASINQQGIILVLAATVSPVGVVIYSAHRTVAGLLRYPFQMIQAPLWPELSILGGQQEQKRLQEVSLMATRAIIFISGYLSLFLLVWIPIIFEFWTDSQIRLHSPLLGMFIFQTLLFTGWSSSGWPLLATNRHRFIAIWDTLNAGVTIGLALLLSEKAGIYGVALATLLGDITCGLLIYPRISAEYLNTSKWLIYKNIFLSLFPSVILVPFVISLTNTHGDVSFGLFMSLLFILLFYPATRVTFGSQGTDKLKSTVSQLGQSAVSGIGIFRRIAIWKTH